MGVSRQKNGLLRADGALVSAGEKLVCNRSHCDESSG
jgi:hypothetical protein